MKTHNLLNFLLAVVFVVCCSHDIYSDSTPSFELTHEMIDEALEKAKKGITKGEPKLSFRILEDRGEKIPGQVKKLGEQEFFISLYAENFTPGKHIALFVRNCSDEIKLLSAGYTFNSSVFYYENRDKLSHLEDVKFDLNNFSPTEWIDYILVTEELKEIAAIQVTPRPVILKDTSGHSIKLQLNVGTGTMYSLHFSGFQPEEELSTISKSEHEVIEGKLTCNQDGEAVMMSMPGVIGKTGGTVKWTIDGDDLKESFQITQGWGTNFHSDTHVSPMNKTISD